jgi:hypothetical protein
MKYCPACNFSFPDFHHVCDFDGTELVPEPERKPANNPGSSRLRSALKSPAFLSVLLAITLLSSAILIGYLDSARQSTPQVKTQPVTAAPSNMVSAAEVPEPSSRTRGHLSPRRNLRRLSISVASARREAKSGHPLSRSHPQTAIEGASAAEVSMRNSTPQTPKEKEPRITASKDASTSLNTTFVTRRAPQPPSPQKEPKLTAMLKTTWHVLKKPFKF